MAEDAENLSTADVLRLYRHGRRDFCAIDLADRDSAHALRGAVLEGVDFSRAFIVADFSGANLRGSSFRSANLKTCRFDEADLSDVDFRDAAIDAATFTGANLEGADFEGAGESGYTFAKGERPL